MGSFVLGFRPTRAARGFTSKEPKPTSWTFSPSFKASVMASSVAVITVSASFLETSAASETTLMSSALFMNGILLQSFVFWYPNILNAIAC